MSNWYDAEGRPMDFDEWARLHPTIESRRVAKTEVGEGRVSTVLIGLDHRFGGDVPVIFETMIFDGPHDGLLRRYATKADAVNGHRAIVEAIEAGLDPETVPDFPDFTGGRPTKDS